jgi:hypothetical protein
MAELADAADSKSAEGNLVGVRPPLPAPIKSTVCKINASSDAFFCAQTVPKMAAISFSHFFPCGFSRLVVVATSDSFVRFRF